MKHYKLETEPDDIVWNTCVTNNTGFPYYRLLDIIQEQTFPNINIGILLKSKKTGNVYRTIFSSELERRHVLIKWNINQWSYEQTDSSTD